MAGERGSGWVIAATVSCGSRGVGRVTVTSVAQGELAIAY